MFITKASAQSIVFGGAAKVGFRPVEADSRHGPSLPENLISSSTSSGKALVTTELDVLVCNTFSRGGGWWARCDTSSCEAPPAETHRLRSPAPPPAQQEFSFRKGKIVAKNVWQKIVAKKLCQAHLAHCRTCGSVFVHLQTKTNENQCYCYCYCISSSFMDRTFQAFCMSDAQYSSRCFHNDDEVRS